MLWLLTCSVTSDSLQPRGLQHTRLPCPSPSPDACSNSCSLNLWCHPTISSSVVPFFSCLQSFPASVFFTNESALCIRWLKYWSFSFSVCPSNEYPGLISFRIDGLDSLQSKGLSSLLQQHSSEASVLQRSAFFMVQLSHPYMTTRKNMALTRQIFVGKVTSLLFNMLSMIFIAFLPKNKHL